MRGLGLIVMALSFISSAYSLSEEASQIAARLEKSKTKSRQMLTREKDVAPLIARVDQDLVLLAKQKQDLEREKQLLMQRKETLEAAVTEKRIKLATVEGERTHLESVLNSCLVDLQSLIAQRSIQTEMQQVFAQSHARDTLLAGVFETTSMATSTPLLLTAAAPQFVLEDVRG